MPATNAPGNQAFARDFQGFERRLRSLETQQNYVLTDPRAAGNEGDPAHGNAVAVLGALQAVSGIPHEWGIAVYDHGKGVWCRLNCEGGAEGPPGPEGKAGPEGPPGPEGKEGKEGPEGKEGKTGSEGKEGAKGTTGATGAEGPAGPKGTTGATGPEGPPGPEGKAGKEGPEGKEGKAGSAFSAEVGDGVHTEYPIAHELGTKHVVTNVYEKTAPFAEVIPTVQITDENHVTLIFLTAPSANQYVLVVSTGGGGSEPTYAALIAADAPVNGWDLQDAVGVGALAATYGAQALSSLKGVTSGDAVTPLYPGAKAIHVAGGENDGAATAAAGALTTYDHMTAEAWVYLPADSGLAGGVLFVGNVAEGYGIGIGKGAWNSTSGDANYLTTLKPGIAFRGGPSAEGVAGEANVWKYMTQLAAGWHHLAWRTEQAARENVEVFIDGARVGLITTVGGEDHTAAERVQLGGIPGLGGYGLNSAGILVAHAYVYNKRLTNAAIRARSDLIERLNA